jgi:hypothetical protein
MAVSLVSLRRMPKRLRKIEGLSGHFLFVLN